MKLNILDAARDLLTRANLTRGRVSESSNRSVLDKHEITSAAEADEVAAAAIFLFGTGQIEVSGEKSTSQDFVVPRFNQK